MKNEKNNMEKIMHSLSIIEMQTIFGGEGNPEGNDEHIIWGQVKKELVSTLSKKEFISISDI